MAQKPSENVKLFIQSNEYNDKKRLLNLETNKYKVDIDRTCFTKTKLEKEYLKQIKSLYKSELNKQKK